MLLKLVLTLALASRGCSFIGAPALRAAAAPRAARAPAPRMAAAETRALNVGLVGGGTVGGGIVEILGEKAEFLRAAFACDVKVTHIAVRDPATPRTFAVPDGAAVTGDWAAVVDDPNVDVVVEVMGGTTLAREVIERSLRGGKSVVTANKALIADQMGELLGVLADAERDAAADGRAPPRFGFEAAVCGGIPVIHVLQGDLAGDSVTQLSGIMNGCTNFMLTGMEKEGKSYDDVLAVATELGFAEADPTLDVGGFDARSKLKILIKLAFGLDLDEDVISCAGIPEIEKIDFEYAGMEGGTIKLLATAGFTEAADGARDGEQRLSAYVSPCFVKKGNFLASITGATNAVQIQSASLGQSTLVGQGAGRFPTANSCVSDIIAIARGTCAPQPFAKARSPPALAHPPPKTHTGFRPASSAAAETRRARRALILAPRRLRRARAQYPEGNIVFSNDFKAPFYIRMRYADRVGIIRDLGEITEKHGVSIYSLLQNPIVDREDSAFVVFTDPCFRSQAQAVASDIEHMAWAIGQPFVMPVME